MPDAEKPEWQKYYDEHEWTRETVERILLGFLHEIRAPLTGLHGSVQILKTNPTIPAPLLALSEKRLENLNALVYETIDYVKKRIEDEKKANG
jgi:nitrogen-specific signal transduction histidine kinase